MPIKNIEDNSRQRPEIQIRDAEGQKVSWHYSNSEPQAIDVVHDIRNYTWKKNQPNGFFIIPLINSSITSGQITVTLLDQKDGEKSIIYFEEIDAYNGQAIPARIKKIWTNGTTVDRIKVVW